VHLTIAVVGGFIGAVSFSGSADRLRQAAGLITQVVRFGGQKFLNLLHFAGHLGARLHGGSGMAYQLPRSSLFFVLALLLGLP
jgi:hypothetical protein